MNGWTVQLEPQARREFRLLEDGPKRDAADLLEDLREGPDAVPSIELRANPNMHRARFHHGMYRMVYLVAEGQKKIIVKRIRPRAIAYKGMKSPGVGG